MKSGCNDAFIVRAEAAALARACSAGAPVTVRDGSREGLVESGLLRPLLRGEHAVPWRCARPAEYLLWTHGADGLPLDRLPPHAEHWLRPWRRTLAARSDARGRGRWWSLFRTEGAQPRWARVVWCDIGRTPRASVLDAGDPMVPLNSCYVLRCAESEDALAFAALLNSPIVAAWLAVLAEPARGGYRRYLGWTVSELPIPIDWPRSRAILAPLAREACRGGIVGPDDLSCAAADAYGLTRAELAPLLDWPDAY